MSTPSHKGLFSYMEVIHQGQSVPNKVTAELLQVTLLKSNEDAASDVGVNKALGQSLHSTRFQEAFCDFLRSPFCTDMDTVQVAIIVYVLNV